MTFTTLARLLLGRATASALRASPTSVGQGNRARLHRPQLHRAQLPRAHLHRADVLAALRACASPPEVAASLAFREADAPEQCVPRVALTRSRDGSTGTATFRFDEATVLGLDDIWTNGLVTGLWLSDDEGQLHTSDLSLRFDKGRPVELVAILVLKSTEEWERFMRFMERYAETSGMSFVN